jgi:hypothetical protein
MILLLVLNVGNGWVAGGCWDYEIDSSCGSFPHSLLSTSKFLMLGLLGFPRHRYRNPKSTSSAASPPPAEIRADHGVAGGKVAGGTHDMKWTDMIKNIMIMILAYIYITIYVYIIGTHSKLYMASIESVYLYMNTYSAPNPSFLFAPGLPPKKKTPKKSSQVVAPEAFGEVTWWHTKAPTHTTSSRCNFGLFDVSSLFLLVV